MRIGALALAFAFMVAHARWLAPAAAQEPERKAQVYALPVVFWTPETRLGFGALGGVQLRAARDARPSYAQASAVYTLESQGSVDLLLELYPSRTVVLVGEARIAHFPDTFWAIGPRTRDADEEHYTSRHAEVLLAPEVYVLPGRLRAGPRLYFRRESMRDVDADGRIAARAVTGAGGVTTVGLGATATWDTRDGSFWPTRGAFSQVSYLFHPAALGDASDFGRAAVDVRRFVPLPRGHVLALGGHAEAAHGAVPFTLLPELGGGETLRGYYRGRWRDRVYWAAQGEYRFPIRGRFRGVAFAGAGGVAPAADEVFRAPVRPAGGAGLRFRVTDAGVNIRGDVAIGEDGVQVYLLTLEAL